MSNGEDPTDKRNRISFVLILFTLLATLIYLGLRHGNSLRGRYDGSPDSYLWKLAFLGVVTILVSIYVWWANKRDFK
jgi:hypothetical protein